jgi:hypothetical protein
MMKVERVEFKEPIHKSKFARSLDNMDLDKIFDNKKRLAGYYNMRFGDEESKFENTGKQILG